MISEEIIQKECLEYFKEVSKENGIGRYEVDFSDIDFESGAKWAIKEMENFTIKFYRWAISSKEFEISNGAYNPYELLEIFKQQNK